MNGVRSFPKLQDEHVGSCSFAGAQRPACVVTGRNKVGKGNIAMNDSAFQSPNLSFGEIVLLAQGYDLLQ